MENDQLLLRQMTFRSNLKKKLARIGVKALKMKPNNVAKTLGISRATIYRYLKDSQGIGAKMFDCSQKETIPKDEYINWLEVAV